MRPKATKLIVFVLNKRLLVAGIVNTEAKNHDVPNATKESDDEGDDWVIGVIAYRRRL